ncbi:MAG: NADP-dependent oxidoreductase [Spirochaetota bacterium]
MFGRKQRNGDTMVAVVVRSFGGLEALSVERAEVPRPRSDEVLIAVKAIGINPLDWKVRRGESFAEALGPPPFVPGWDVSGEVAEVGPRVTSLTEGQEVFGLVNFPSPGGAYAEYVVAAAGDLLPKPEGLSHAEAAALPLAGTAAWQGLFRDGKVTSGHRILIHGAAGGVGHIAVQLAKWKGATVVASASARNLEYLSRIGADETVDYTAERPFEGIDWVDLILDAGGCSDNPELMAALVRWGRYIVFCGRRAPSPRLHYFKLKPDRKALSMLATLAAEGTVRLTTTSVPSLESIAQAHSMSESGHARGKIVVPVGSSR